MLFVLFWLGVGLAVAAQTCNYAKPPRREPDGAADGRLRAGRPRDLDSRRYGVQGCHRLAETLPTSLEGLSPGQLWNNGGLPAIVRE
jgi:hypothetical protein